MDFSGLNAEVISEMYAWMGRIGIVLAIPLGLRALMLFGQAVRGMFTN